MEARALYSREVEEAFVGALLLDGDLAKECTIKPGQLYMSRLRVLLAAIQRLCKKGEPIDPVSVIQEVGLDNVESVGGISYVTDLAARVHTTANVWHYEKLIQEYDQKRKAVKVASRIQEGVQGEDISTVLKNGIQDLVKLEEGLVDEELGDISSGLVDLYVESEKDQGEVTGISSGFRHWDRLTGGLQESELLVIGARPSMGKTAFALNLALTAARQDVVIIFSLEMPKHQLLRRAVGLAGSISSVKMRNPRRHFEEADWAKLTGAMGMLSEANLHIFDKPAMDIGYMWAKVRKLRREYGNGKRFLVIIDYLQLIAGDAKYRPNRQAEISEISRMLKMLARDCQVAVAALSQLSRGVESRQDKRPILPDLRESGQIEQDADVIAFLYRDDYYRKDTDQPNIVEVILAKQRNGPIGTIRLTFDKECGRFGDV
ncbi:replicative DNA helicase [Siminovitchia fortis]|uniref:Replicative DNA helicase n=1 Tax=Siminovitchia fortis TaxID=254758 RepID=A0A443IV04_9BACI|nr:replicative DNA helicase [Siminovitchia fortis]RWR11901.1 replicative DNA helicase [Siminovitchia fortis]WHY81815.1 replicative DNA helicase [Siminovitchia fortis]